MHPFPQDVKPPRRWLLLPLAFVLLAIAWSVILNPTSTLPHSNNGHCYRVGEKDALLSPLSGGACVPEEKDLEAAEKKCGKANHACQEQEVNQKYPKLTPELAERYRRYIEAEMGETP